MIYEKRSWIPDEVISADKLNNIENGIESVTSGSNVLQDEIDTLNNIISINLMHNDIQKNLYPGAADWSGSWTASNPSLTYLSNETHDGYPVIAMAQNGAKYFKMLNIAEAGKQYTFQCWVKTADASDIRMYIKDSDNASATAIFDSVVRTFTNISNNTWTKITGTYNCTFSGAMNPFVTSGNNDTLFIAQYVLVEGDTVINLIDTAIAPNYNDMTFPIAKGSFVIHENELYLSNVNINASEDWNSNHWDKTTVADECAKLSSSLQETADEVDDLKTAVDGIIEYGYNLMPYETKTTTVNDVTISLNDGVFTLNGTANNDGGRLNKLTSSFVLPAGNYYLSCFDTYDKDPTFFIENNSDNSIISSVQHKSDVSFTLQNDTTVYLGCNFNSGKQYNGVYRLQIVSGSTIRPFINPSYISAIDDVARNIAKSWAYALDGVLCIGDSLTAGANYTGSFAGKKIDQNYPRIMGRMLSVEVENGGVNGITTKDWYNNEITKYNLSAYDTFIIWLGTNGGFTDTLDVDVDPYNDYTDYADTNTGNYCKIIEKIKDENDSCLIILSTLFVSSGDLATSNKVIRQIAERYSLPIVDNSDLTYQLYPQLHGDIQNVHFSKSGNIYLANRFINFIEKYIANNPIVADFGETVGKKTSMFDELSDLRTDIDANYGSIIVSPELEGGTISSAGQPYSRNDRIRTVDYIDLSEYVGNIIIPENHAILPAYYNSNKVWQENGPWFTECSISDLENYPYVRFAIRNNQHLNDDISGEIGVISLGLELKNKSNAQLTVDVNNLKPKVLDVHAKSKASGTVATFNNSIQSPIDGLKAHFTPKQSGTGVPSPNNIMPITGWTGFSVYRSGKNMFPISFVSPTTYNGITFVCNTDKTVSFSGETRSADILFTLGTFALSAGNYTITGAISNAIRLRVYNEDTQTLIGHDAGNGYNIALTTAANITVQIRITSTIGDSISGTISPMICPAYVADKTFEPYVGKAITINWGNELGTVYGGYLDLVNGEVVTEWAVKTLTQNDTYTLETWPDRNRVAWSGYMTLGKLNGSFICDRLKTISNGQGAIGDDVWEIFGSVIAPRCWITVPTSISSVQDFKDWVAENPINIAYQLATPIHTSISPAIFNTLYGLNNIWSNANGNIEATYYVDPTFIYDSVNNIEQTINIILRNDPLTPALLQELVANGNADKFFNIGDVIYIPWTDNTPSTPVEYQFPFIVVDIADVYDNNDVLHKNGLWLMAMYAEPQEIPFDAAEDTTVNLTQEPNALEGWYYWGVSGDTYTALNLSTGATIPTTYNSVHKCGINNLSVLQKGYNRWKDSAYRQWLNSDASKNTGWWTSQHLGDVAPEGTYTNKPGWLNGFSADWKAIFKQIKVQTATNTLTDSGVIDTTYDKFFLPSLEQMYGVPRISGVGVEGKYWPYWKEETGLDSPSTGSSADPNDARKVPSIAAPLSGSINCRLRSVNISTSQAVYNLSSGGHLNDFSSAFAIYRCLPACVIY